MGMAGEPSNETAPNASVTRWGREGAQHLQYGLGAVLLGVLLPVALGVPEPGLRPGRFVGEIVLGISLLAVFANVVLMLAAHVGRRRREWWFALGGLGLAMAHPVLDGVLSSAGSWLGPARLAIGTVSLLALSRLIELGGWQARAVRSIGVTLGGLALVAVAVETIDPGAPASLTDSAAFAFAGAAIAVGGIAFIYGQRSPDGTLISFGMTALAVGFGGLLLLVSGDTALTVSVATVSAVAAVAAIAASIMSLLEALARRELRREALMLSRGLALARLEAQADRFSELAHDQRSALLAIEAAAERMRTQPSGQLAAAVASEAARLNRLLADRTDGADAFDLHAAVLPMVECMRAFGSEIGVSVHDDVSVWGGVDEVVEIVGVLIDNALTHGQAPVRVEIGAHENGAVLRVSDSGPGVPAPLRESVFERGVSTRPAAHSGLGLFSARRMAEAAHGSLSIADADGAFELVLPTDRPDPVVDTDTDAGVGDATSDHG